MPMTNLPADVLARPLADHPDAALYEACSRAEFQEEPL